MIMESPEQNRDIVLMPGVLPVEESHLSLYLSPEENRSYRGERIPFNYYLYLLRANELAESLNVNLHVAIAGVGRIMSQFGLERAIEIFKGNGTEDEKNFLERILIQEKIRKAVTLAVGDALKLARLKSVTSITSRIVEEDAFRDRLFQTIHLMGENADTLPVDYFGSKRMFYEVLTRDALPKNKRLEPDSESPEAIQRRTLYSLTEGALAYETIVQEARSYVAHRGSDIVYPSHKAVSISEALRAAIGGRIGAPPFNAQTEEFLQHWLVNPNLDGLAFYPTKNGNKPPERCDPYYIDLLSIEDTVQRPLKIPAHPWVRGWLTTNMRSETGGILTGQAEGVVRDGINPILRRQLRLAFENPPAEAVLLASQRAHEMQSLREWLDDPNMLIPLHSTLGDLNDNVRGLCEAVGQKALSLMQSGEK